MSQLATCAMTSYDPLDAYGHVQLDIPSTNGTSISSYAQPGHYSNTHTNHTVPQARLNDSKLKRSLQIVRNLIPELNESMMMQLRQESFRQALQNLAECSEEDVKRLMAPQTRKRPVYQQRLALTSMEPGAVNQRGSGASVIAHSRASSATSTPSTLSPTILRPSAGFGSDFSIGTLGFSSRPNSMQEFSQLPTFAEHEYVKSDHSLNSNYTARPLSESRNLAYDVSHSTGEYVYTTPAYAQTYPETSMSASDGQASAQIHAIAYPMTNPNRLSSTSTPWSTFDDTTEASIQATETSYMPESHAIMWEASRTAAPHLSGTDSANRSSSRDTTRNTPQPTTTAYEQHQLGVATRPRLRRKNRPIGSQSPSSIRNSATEQTLNRIPCPELSCRGSYTVHRELREHIASEHEQEVQYICQHNNCNKSVFREDRFKHHHTKDHKNCQNFSNSGECELASRKWRKQNWGCNVCSEGVFRDMENWTAHYAHHFQNEHRPDTDRSFSKLIHSLLCQASTVNVWAGATLGIRSSLQWNESNERCQKLRRVLEEGFFQGNPLEVPGVAEDVVKYALSCAKQHSPLNSATKRQATRSPSQSTSSGDTKSRENLFNTSSRTGTPGLRQQSSRRY